MEIRRAESDRDLAGYAQVWNAITPSAGPPVACPIAFAWPLMDMTVARTLESVICRFSQVV